MKTEKMEVYSKGKWISVPSVTVEGVTLIVSGRWLRYARVYREDWLEEDPIRDAEAVVRKLKSGGAVADILTFAQRLPETQAKYRLPFEMDNVAAVPVSTFDEWYNSRISRKTRQEIVRAGRLGVVVRRVPFDDGFVSEVVGLFGEISSKQGVPFEHRGKDHAAVKRDLSSYTDRSDFIGAYVEGRLVGYLKLVHLARSGSILNLIAGDAHYDKRPSNALIAEAVKLCEARGKAFLQYGKYTYGNKTDSSLTEFKRRNGFEKIEVPRYFVPLTLRGAAATKMKLHRGLLGVLPPRVISLLLKARSYVNGGWKRNGKVVSTGERGQSRSREEAGAKVSEKE